MICISVCDDSLALLEFQVVVLVSLGPYAFLLLFPRVISEAADAANEADGIQDHGEGDGLHLGVGVVGEVSDEPPVALLDQEDQDGEEEEREEDDTRAIVPAAFHDWVHFFLCCLFVRAVKRSLEVYNYLLFPLK